MKKSNTIKASLAVFVQLACTMCLSQDITIDVTPFDGKHKISSETDFTKPFVLTFTNNKKSAAKIVILSSDGVTPAVLKDGIKEADKQSIQFNFNSDGRQVTIKKQDGTDLVLDASPLQLFYGKDEIQIVNKAAGPPPPPSPDKIQTATGIEIHDALLAKRYYETGNDSLFILLGEIKKPLPAKPKKADLLAAYSSNNFIVDILNSYVSVPKVAVIQGGQDLKGISGFISKVGNTDVTTVVDGIARFLVKRTKQELNIAFFQHFKDLINKPEYKDAQILFPKTMETLNSIDQEIYLFENYITTLRESFEKDLSLLLDNMLRVIEEGRFKDYFTSKPNIKYSLLLTLFTGRELVNGTHPGKILESLPSEYLHEFKNADNTENKTVSGTFETLQLLSKSLRSRDPDRYWTSLDTIQLLYKNDEHLIAAKFYLGFVYENSANILFNKDKKLQDYLTAISRLPDSIKKYITFIKELGKKCHDVESAIAQIKIKKPETPSIDVYNRLFNSFADVIEHINGLGDLPGINIDSDSKIVAGITKYLKIIRQANDLALNLAQKNYGSAVVNTYNIYLAATEVKKGNALSVDIAHQNDELFAVAANSTSATEHAASNKNAVTTSDFIKKYGTFMANVVKAKTSEEVAAAIESVALPVGSASIKRHNNWNIALNAYVGLYLGAEKIGGIDDKYKINAYGITAPIGISISKGWNWEKSSGWSTSLFFSVVDIGAPVAFRFKDDKTEQIPSIQLKDIVSPGIFLSTGFPKIPISMNIGWQMGPVLRKINASVADKASSNYSRFSISFLVDIPVFNFYTSSK